MRASSFDFVSYFSFVCFLMTFGVVFVGLWFKANGMRLHVCCDRGAQSRTKLVQFYQLAFTIELVIKILSKTDICTMLTFPTHERCAMASEGAPSVHCNPGKRLRLSHWVCHTDQLKWCWAFAVVTQSYRHRLSTMLICWCGTQQPRGNAASRLIICMMHRLIKAKEVAIRTDKIVSVKTKPDSPLVGIYVA